ncbi:MAG: hypothetical protein EAY75_13415, partial [Bacteroidetes bacterium]
KKRNKKIKGCRNWPKNSGGGLNPGKLAEPCFWAQLRAGSNSARLFNGPHPNFFNGHFLRPPARSCAAWLTSFLLCLCVNCRWC